MIFFHIFLSGYQFLNSSELCVVFLMKEKTHTGSRGLVWDPFQDALQIYKAQGRQIKWNCVCTLCWVGSLVNWRRESPGMAASGHACAGSSRVVNLRWVGLLWGALDRRLIKLSTSFQDSASCIPQTIKEWLHLNTNPWLCFLTLFLKKRTLTESGTCRFS